MMRPDMDTLNDTGSKNPETDVNWTFCLNDGERSWGSGEYRYLLKNGYELMSRLRPGRVGSWVGTARRPEECEDSVGWKVIFRSLS